MKITVYNALGKEVGTLMNDVVSAGDHYANLDGSNLSSGVYYYRIEAGQNTATGKMLLVK